MNKHCIRGFIVVALCSLILDSISSSVAQAGILTFTNRAAWQVAAGSTTHFENFDQFLVDTQFRSGPLALNGFTIQETGVTISDLNFVDTNPFSFSENAPNATAFAQGGTNFGATFVDLEFNAQTSAFGADFRGADGTEQLRIDILSASNAVLGTLDPSVNTVTFLGFVATAGEDIRSLRFRSGSNDSSGRESFGMDNVEIVQNMSSQVPEPTSATAFVLLGSICVIHAFWRKRNGLA